MLGKLSNYLNLVRSYIKLNFKIQLEYRGAFTSLVLAMFLSNCIWVLFWGVFYSRLPVCNGYGAAEIITVWSITCAGWGIAGTIFGNTYLLPAFIARGQLDAWMLYPRAILPHLALGRMKPAALGDVLFGYAVYIFFVRPDLAHFAMFILMSISGAILCLGFGIAVGSLGFWLGNAESIELQMRSSLFILSTYPAELFEGPIKILLYTLIPAGFLTFLPIQALRHLSFADAALAVIGSLAVITFSVVLFYCGLKRYESGNLAEMRG